MGTAPSTANTLLLTLSLNTSGAHVRSLSLNRSTMPEMRMMTTGMSSRITSMMMRSANEP